MAENPQPQTIAPEPGATESSSSFSRVLFSWHRWWLEDVVGTVDQSSVIEKRREECGLTERYLFMTAMSGGIAILGLLLSSPAVVIGAMLLSPLMGPIMGLGFALAIGDYNWMKQSARSLAWGSLMAILLCALIVFFSPIQTVTPEIAARTRPNLFDLLVALFSALAGAYAMIRGREGTIVGVAIATALMPPLAVVGYGVATTNWTVFSGALLLYVTNLLTIAITAWGMARLYGFRTSLSERNTLLQNLGIASVVVALAIPLIISLQNIAWETNAQRVVRSELQDAFGSSARIDQFAIDFAASPMTVDATVLTPRLNDTAEQQVREAIRRRLSEDVDLAITQFQVGTSASAAEQAQLSAARANEEATATRRAEDLAKRLALAAGVSENDVTIDRLRRRAIVRAQPLTGASLSTYRELEQRIVATEPDWMVELLPPSRPLPVIPFNEGEPTQQGRAAIDLIVWAAQRIDLPILIEGEAEDAERVVALLAERRISATAVPVRRATTIQARWGEPED